MNIENLELRNFGEGLNENAGMAIHELIVDIIKQNKGSLKTIKLCKILKKPQEGIHLFNAMH